MKVIDFAKKGNVIRLYLGEDDCNDYWGDDWDDAPYEHNAGEVYEEYVKDVVEFAFPTRYIIQEPSDDYAYDCNSPFSKEDFKDKKAPCLIIIRWAEDDWSPSYSKYLGAQDGSALRIYYGDKIDKVRDDIIAFGGIEFMLI